jgi:hypothetical protein
MVVKSGGRKTAGAIEPLFIEDFASTNGLIEVHERYSLSYPLTISILIYLFRLIYNMDMYRTARHDSQLLNHNEADFYVVAYFSLHAEYGICKYSQEAVCELSEKSFLIRIDGKWQDYCK